MVRFAVSFGAIVMLLGMVRGPVGPVVAVVPAQPCTTAPVRGRERSVHIQVEVPVAGVVRVGTLTDDEEPAALDGGIGWDSRLHDRALGEVRLHGGNLCAGAYRRRVGAGQARRGPAPGSELLGEDVRELDVGLLVAVGVGVRDVVTYGVDLGLHRADTRVGSGK